MEGTKGHRCRKMYTRDGWVHAWMDRRRKKTCERSRIGQDGYQQQRRTTHTYGSLYNLPENRLLLKAFSPFSCLLVLILLPPNHLPPEYRPLFVFIDKTPGRIYGRQEAPVLTPHYPTRLLLLSLPFLLPILYVSILLFWTWFLYDMRMLTPPLESDCLMTPGIITNPFKTMGWETLTEAKKAKTHRGIVVIGDSHQQVLNKTKRFAAIYENLDVAIWHRRSLQSTKRLIF